MTPTISVMIIVKNETLQLEKCLLSIKDHVDQIVIVDTGSTDGSQDIAKKYCHVFEQFSDCNNPDTGLIRDFSIARNRALELATGDFVIWIDADDELAGGEKLRKIVQDIANYPDKDGKAFSVSFPYEYAYDADGNPVVRQYRERLVYPKKDFHWVNPVHEILNPDNPNTLAMVSDEVVFKHRRDGKFIEPRRNLNILKALYEKDGEKDARQLYYLGLEYGNVGENDEMIKMLSRYIELSGWDDEKYFAMMRVAQHYLGIGDYENVITWSLKATACKEKWGEAYFMLCRAYYFLAQAGKDTYRNWERAVHFGKMGLALPPTQTLLFLNPTERSHDIYVYLNVAQSNIGDVAGALESCKKGLEAKADSEFLLANKKVYEKQLALNSLDELVKNETITKDTKELISKVFDGIPSASIQGIGFEEFNKPAEYPMGIESRHFPVAKISPHKNAWALPESWDVDSLPVRMSDNQLQAVVLLMWKELMAQDEIQSAIKFLENAPYRVRHSVATEKALKMTRDSIAWIDNLDVIQKNNSPEDVMTECGEPLPRPLMNQQGGRYNLVKDKLSDPSEFNRIVDFGCGDGAFTNRYGLLGYNVVGLDLSETSVALANRKAEEFKTGSKHIITHFDKALEVVAEKSFDYATSTDTYEHLKDPVSEMLIPAKKMLKDSGRFLMCTPYGSWMRGNYVPWAHPWLWSKINGTSWLSPNPRFHLIAPTPWSTAKDFRTAGYWVKNCYAVLCEPGDVPSQGNVFVEALTNPPVNNKPLDIVFFIGDGVECWTPHSVEKSGIGGSELMAIEMSKRLAGLGHKVRVYSGVGEHGEGIYDGVEYRRSEKYQDLTCDVLYVSRNAAALSDSFNIQAKLKLLWVHDVVPIAYTNELLLKADRILCLSEWHKQNVMNVCNVHSDHIIVTRNGIDMSRFEGKDIKRNKYKCINSSSPDRSWPVLLQVWPKIKEQVPEATLTLAYGWKNWEYSAQWDKSQQDLIKKLKDKIEELKSLGVSFIGRVDQKKLAEEMLSAGANLHCTWFTETSGITFMENQAAGVRIVSSSIGALNETVADRGILIDGIWTDQSYQDKFIQEAVKALTDE